MERGELELVRGRSGLEPKTLLLCAELAKRRRGVGAWPRFTCSGEPGLRLRETCCSAASAPRHEPGEPAPGEPGERGPQLGRGLRARRARRREDLLMVGANVCSARRCAIAAATLGEKGVRLSLAHTLLHSELYGH